MAHAPLLGVALVLAGTLMHAPTRATAQDTPGAPLSVIDWLDRQPAAVKRPPRRPSGSEPSVTASGTAPQVTVTTLGAGRPREIGLVPPSLTGLPADLWAGSDVAQLVKRLETLPELRLPAAQSLLYTVLLAEAQAPQSNAVAGNRLALARVGRLMDLGALDPAMALIEQAGVRSSPQHFALWMQISLLNGTEDRACATLQTAPHLSDDYATRILCAARAGAWKNAALTLGSAKALGLMPKDRIDLLDRFLNPDLFEDAAPLRPPRVMDPLAFRLFETIGEPLPTSNLPRPYAAADLRDLAGWKAQLEAAERLTRAGALPDNRLLGLYTERRAAASGGVWDRVRALQQFETALNTRSADAITKTLPRAWRIMQDANLGSAFASLFAESLSKITLEGRAADAAFEVGLMSPHYEATAARAADDPAKALLRGVAMGEVTTSAPRAALAAAVHTAFTAPAPRVDLVKAAQDKQLGHSILDLLALLEDGAQGDANALATGLATLRALGLEDTARRAALHILIKGR